MTDHVIPPSVVFIRAFWPIAQPVSESIIKNELIRGFVEKLFRTLHEYPPSVDA